MNHFDAFRAVREAVGKSQLSNREKRRINAALFFRPRKREEILGFVTAECHVEGMVSEDGEIEAAADWQQIIELILKWLPEILRLFF